MTKPTEQQLHTLLLSLCVDLGFCLPKLVTSRLAKCPPKTPQRFAKAVIEADGLTIDTIDKHLYKSVLSKIETVFNK